MGWLFSSPSNKEFLKRKSKDAPMQIHEKHCHLVIVLQIQELGTFYHYKGKEKYVYTWRYKTFSAFILKTLEIVIIRRNQQLKTYFGFKKIDKVEKSIKKNLNILIWELKLKAMKELLIKILMRNWLRRLSLICLMQTEKTDLMKKLNPFLCIVRTSSNISEFLALFWAPRQKKEVQNTLLHHAFFFLFFLFKPIPLKERLWMDAILRHSVNLKSCQLWNIGLTHHSKIMHTPKYWAYRFKRLQFVKLILNY